MPCRIPEIKALLPTRACVLWPLCFPVYLLRAPGAAFKFHLKSSQELLSGIHGARAKQGPWGQSAERAGCGLQTVLQQQKHSGLSVRVQALRIALHSNSLLRFHVAPSGTLGALVRLFSELFHKHEPRDDRRGPLLCAHEQRASTLPARQLVIWVCKVVDVEGPSVVVHISSMDAQ